MTSDKKASLITIGIMIGSAGVIILGTSTVTSFMTNKVASQTTKNLSLLLMTAGVVTAFIGAKDDVMKKIQLTK